ncbi:MAG: hypothetical protein NT018_13365 [Armatimonadetes bacterium]|nr:hypothetical protein [Armatimonadota bacterium]
MKNISAVIIILFSITSPSDCSGFLPQIVRYKPLGIARSTGMSIGSAKNLRAANVAIEYSAENLLRTKVNGKLTADMTTSEMSQSVFFPLNFGANTTEITFSRASSGADLFYDDPKTGSQLSLQADSYRYAISHKLGTERISLTGSRYSGLCDGSSVYPKSLFKIFTGSAATKIAINQRSSALQFVHPLPQDGEITFSAGNGNWDTSIEFTQNTTALSIPISVKTRNYSLGAERELAKNIKGRIGYEWSDGSSADNITKNKTRIGKTQSQPGFRRTDLSFQYNPNPTITWETGWVSAEQSLFLRGLNINGNALGLKVKPFADQVDFKANMSLSASFYHLGLQRQLSDKWQFGARYKLIHAVSSIDGDYVGRGFLGLISASGIFNSTPINNRIHGLELSAAYTTGAVSTILRLEQLIPQKNTNHTTGHTQQESKSKSTGGTSVSLTSSYAF